MLFILNRQEKVVGVLKNSGKNSVPFFNDLLTEDLATGSETFEFTTVSRNGIGQHLVVGNFIAFKKGKSYKLFQIMQTEEDHQDELYITVYAECAGLQLINSVFRGVKIVSASFERVMQTLLSDTSWNVGILPYGLATTYDLDIEQASVYSLLQTYAQQYGVELEFRVELNHGKISKKYINGYYNRGKVTGKRFTYERDIEGIVRKTDATELYTALIGRGNNEISFKDVTVDGIDKPMGQDFVANQSAYEKYNNNGYHIVGIYECDTDDAKDLLRKTHKRLLEVSEPKVEYDISVLLLCELLGEKWNEVAIGDTISVFDNAYYPPIMVSARVSKLQTSMTDKNANKCTLANFIEVKSNITSEMRKIASQLQGYVDNRFPIGSSDIQDGAVGMDKISDIYTQTITTDILKAGKVETEKLIAQEAEITNAKIENLKADFIEADKIITDTIVANKAEFDILEAKVGKIDTLVSGNISSENIQTGGITGSNLNMDTIFVKDANILDLSASKLTAGEINTSQVVISSADGGMRLIGSTQQFVDENNRIRIQLGKDANGDFDFYILAENGDILFNTRGITGNAIENGLIKENMVSDGAIGGTKINWSSFVTEFNKDSNTHKLNSSKVLLDGTNQTLDIHFNQLKSKMDDNVSQTESNTTQIGINQGKINTLIQDTTITKDSQTLKLKDAYSKLEQTVDGLKSTVGEQQTTINQNTGKITAAESKVSTLEQTVNGFNSELSHVKTTIDEQEEAIDSVNSALSGKANSNDVYKKSETMTTSAINSAINQSADSIKLGISETYETKTNVESKISTAVNNVQVGGTNIIKGTNTISQIGSTGTWSAGTWRSASGGTGTREIVTVSSSPNPNIKKGIKITTTSDTTGNTDIAQDKVPVVNGATYTLSCYARKISGDATLKLQYGKVSYSSTTAKITSTSWTKFSYTFTIGTVADDSTDGSTNIYFGLTGRLVGSAEICGFKLEYGNKATDWTPAPEDIDSAIGTKANSNDVYKKTEVYTKAETNSQINVAKDSITNTVSTSYLSKSDATNTYATKSSLTQTANNITAKFESSGGYNLLKNSKGQNGTAYWLDNGKGINIDSDETFGTCFKTSAPSGIKYSEAIKLKNNTEYVYEGYIYSMTAINGGATSPLHFWCNTAPNTSGNKQLTVLDYRQAVPTAKKWTKCYVHFRTASSGNVYFTPFVHVGGSITFNFLVTELSLSESVVESKWTPHPDEIYSGSTVIDASGVTIKNGAIKIKNNTGDTVLAGDSAGNLTLNGTIRSESSNGRYVSLNSGGVTFNDSQRSEEVLRMATSYQVNRDINGVTVALPQYGDFLAFRHIAKPSLENGWTSSDTQYNFMDMWAADYTDSKGFKFYKGINFLAPVYYNQKIRFRNGSSQYLHEITPNITWNSLSGLMGIYGDNGTVLGYKTADSLNARIVVTEENHSGTADVIKSWGHWNCSGYIVHNATFRGNHENSYSNAVARAYSTTSGIEAEEKQVRFNFENVQIKEGRAVLNVPKRYTGVNNGYVVSSIVKKGKGDVWVADEQENRFIIEADADIKVNVEIIIKISEVASCSVRATPENTRCFDTSTGQLIEK